MIRRTRHKPRKVPKMRRQYSSVFGLDGGLDFSKATTAIGDKFSPSCSEVLFRYGKVIKAKGTQYFAGTDTVPLLGTVMHVDQYYKTTGSDKLIVHTNRNSYAYNTSTQVLECITLGEVVEDCEDAWSDPGAQVSVALDNTNFRKGAGSVKITLESGFTTGIGGYENFAAKDLTSYTHLHYYIKSDIGTAAGDLLIRLSEQNAGGTGATYADYNVPALSAGVWQEVGVALDSPDADDGGTYPTDLDAVLSVSLVVGVDNGAQVVNIDDVMATIESTGDEDDVVSSEIMNDYYVHTNKIAPIKYWDMSADTMASLAGCASIGAKKLGKYGERFILFHVVDTGTVYPQRVQWTVAGGLSTPPNATDWSGVGSGNTDLESTMGVDFIKDAEKIGNYYAIYGERTIVLMDYTGRVSAPFSFYTRVSGIGLPAERAIVNLGNEHIFLGWDDVYIYRGGKDVERIGGRIRKELFALVAPAYINRCFMVFVEETDEIRLYYPTTADTVPTKYFSYNLETRAWSKGSRSYTGFGYFSVETSPTWNTIGDDANTTWDDLPPELRWDDATLEALAPLNLFGDGNGVIFQDNETTNNLAGAAIDGYWETKDFIVGERYRALLTNWMELQFEAIGNGVDVSYSLDQGGTWSTTTTFTLTSTWAKYKLEFNGNSPMIRFKFRNNTAGETFELRWLEVGYVPASDRGM